MRKVFRNLSSSQDSSRHHRKDLMHQQKQMFSHAQYNSNSTNLLPLRLKKFEAREDLLEFFERYIHWVFVSIKNIKSVDAFILIFQEKVMRLASRTVILFKCIYFYTIYKFFIFITKLRMNILLVVSIIVMNKFG